MTTITTKIEISRHPELPNHQRFFEVEKIAIDLINYNFSIQGFVRIYHESDGSVPKWYSKQGMFYDLKAGEKLVNKENSEFYVPSPPIISAEGDVTLPPNDDMSMYVPEVEYYLSYKIMDLTNMLSMLLNIPIEEVNLSMVIAVLINQAVTKQDLLKRFD